MRVVLDTNVLISAFMNTGRCAEVFVMCLRRHEMAVSEHLLAEADRVLRGKLRSPPADAEDFTKIMREDAHLFEPAHIEPNACRDPDDPHILGLAVAAEADCIVTGDRDLLVLSPFRGIPILSPGDFVDHPRERDETE